MEKFLGNSLIQVKKKRGSSNTKKEEPLPALFSGNNRNNQQYWNQGQQQSYYQGNNKQWDEGYDQQWSQYELGWGGQKNKGWQNNQWGQSQQQQNIGWNSHQNNWGQQNQNQQNNWKPQPQIIQQQGQGNQGNQGFQGNQGNQGQQGQQGQHGFQGNQGQRINQGGQQGQQQIIGSIWGDNLEGMSWVINQSQQQKFSFLNADDFDFKEALEQQIILLEPSPATQKLEQLRKKGQKFKDDRFPPSKNSLCGEWRNVSQWNSIAWKKISQALPKQKIFVDKPSPMDIRQGYLGDCYFLAGLAALAERPDRIFNLFLLQQQNQQHYYSVKMLYKGKWMTIDMDEQIPFLNGQPAFSKAVDKTLWVMILEKAWAKMYTSYKRIQAGFPQEPLHDLTGAPIKKIHIRKNTYDKEQEWQYLLKASSRQYSMVCSSNPGSDSDKSTSGVVQGHAYTLLNALYLNHSGRQHKIVQLRNPWGKGQFKGKWSDQDPTWNSVSPQEKQRVKFKKDGNDGIFFMPFDDFWKEFRSITIAQINDNASYVYKSHSDKSLEGCYFKVQILKKGIYFLLVDKTPERSFEDKVQSSYRYPRAAVEPGKLINGNIQKMSAFTSSYRTTHQKYDLQPGVYIIKVKVMFDERFQKQFDVNLAVYAQYACTINLASKEDATAFEGRPVQWTGINQEDHSWNNLGGYGYGQGGWQDDQWQQNDGWGNTNLNINNNTGGWTQQPTNNNEGWAQQPINNNGGWTQQPINNSRGWIQQPTNNYGGWEQQPTNNYGGWEQQPTNNANNSYSNNNEWGEYNPRNSNQQNKGWEEGW